MKCCTSFWKPPTLEEFSRELDAAFASVSERNLNKMLESWGENEQSVKTRLINQFKSWPDVLKDKVKIDVQDPDYPGHHCFLSFESVDLSEQDLKNADLSCVNLSDANLYKANLTRAKLIMVNLSNACLHSANLTEAHLAFVDLRNANLSRANLEGAILDYTELDSADLSSANLTGAVGLVEYRQNKRITLGADTRTFFIDKETKFPDDLLLCYFDPELYPEGSGFISNPTTLYDFSENFFRKYTNASGAMVTPPRSAFNIAIEHDEMYEDYMDQWVKAMLPRLKEAWNKREQDSTRSEIQKFLKKLAADAQQG